MRLKGFTMPAAIDPESAPAERAYGCYPLRLMVVGPDGRIAMDQGRGLPGDDEPWDFGAVQEWLDEHTGR